MKMGAKRGSIGSDLVIGLKQEVWLGLLRKHAEHIEFTTHPLNL
jgi:hypothetical protein